MNTLPADIDLHEVHTRQALENAATELRQARELLESITRATELHTMLRDAPAMLARIDTQNRAARIEHQRSLQVHQATYAIELERTRRALEAFTDRAARELEAVATQVQAQSREALGEHWAAIERHEVCATELGQARDELYDATRTVRQVLEVHDIEPKLERIDRFIELLDQAELIRWHRPTRP